MVDFVGLKEIRLSNFSTVSDACSRLTLLVISPQIWCMRSSGKKEFCLIIV